MFAALVLITVTGVLLFLLFTAVSHLLLRKWHESAVRRDA
jgi:NitT/TauT family transport system permease protein